MCPHLLILTVLALVALLSLASADVSTDLTVCVVERAPFSRCAISAPSAWEPSYLVSLFQEVVAGCVGKSTADLVDELSRPAETRSCDIVISPITITDERRGRIKFLSGVYYTYALPVGPAQEQRDNNELRFWLKPFETSAWLTNLGLLLALGAVGGALALFFNAKFGDTPTQQLGTGASAPPHPDSASTPAGSSSVIKDYSILATGSLTSIFGQHPSHGLFPGLDTRGIAVAMAAFFAASVFAVGIVSMQYAGNLAAIQSQPTVVPLYDSIADLYGQKVLTSELYGSALNTNVTVVPPSISNNDDVLAAIRDVDSGKVDAFVWDALIVLAALDTIENENEDVCVYALKKRVMPFEIGFGVGNDVAQNIVDALQSSLAALDASGRVRDLRTQYLDGLTQYIGKPVCPAAAEGLTAGQTAGVYIVPAVVLGLIAVYAVGYLAVMGLRRRRQARRGSSADSAKASSADFYPTVFTSPV